MPGQLLKCDKCGYLFNPQEFEAPTVTLCPECGESWWGHVYPAYRKSVPKGYVGQTVTDDEEASCFFHQTKKAVVSCDSCGRFLCDLCDLPIGDKHVCPTCFQSRDKKTIGSSLDSQRFRYDKLSLWVAIIPHPIASLAALAMVIIKRKAPVSIVGGTRWRMVIAAIIALAWLIFLTYFYAGFFMGISRI